MNKVVTGLAVIGNTVYATSLDKSEIEAAMKGGDMPANTIQTLDLRDPSRAPRQWIPNASTQLWRELVASPDGKFIAGVYQNREDDFRVAIFDAATGSKRGDFQGKSLIWSRPDLFVLFGNEWPSQLIRLRPDGKHSSKRFPDGPKWHASGHPAYLAASVASSDGSTIWGIFVSLRQNGVGPNKTCADAILPKGHNFSAAKASEMSASGSRLRCAFTSGPVTTFKESR